MKKSGRPNLMASALLLLALAACAAQPELGGDLPREKIVLRSALSVNPTNNSVVLPLFRGRSGGQTVWYIVTDSSDREDAVRRGVVHAPLLARAGSVQQASGTGDSLTFPAAPDFSPTRRYLPGAGYFPPLTAQPGAVATAAYSPFIRINGDGPILNAPIVAMGDGPFDVDGHGNTMDRVLAIDTAKRTVTLLLSRGFAEGRAVLYISTEASDPVAAVLERATYTPALGEGDADIGLIAFVNGQTGAGNPQAQGLRHLVRDGRIEREATLRNAANLGSPGNILTAFPTGKTAAGYSPLWAVNPALWSDALVHAGRNLRQTDQAAIYKLAGKGVSGPDGKPLEPAGFVVNCPVVAFLDEAP
jgi:hypothetical protein